MEKIRISKKIFISRPMNGVTREEDNKLLEEIREALFKEHILGNFVNAEVVNTWLGPVVPDDISDEQARVWRLGRAISEMATADVLIFFPSGAKGCQVEIDVYRNYKNVMGDKWNDTFVYWNNHLKRIRELPRCYPWGPGRKKCDDAAADLIVNLTYNGYPNEVIEDAVNLSKKIIDTEEDKQ